MPRFSPSFLQELADRTSMVELVGRYVPLSKKGSAWKGRCPFHTEKTPSFTVSEQRKSFKCFGCGEGGDAISFLQKIQGMSFPEAVRELVDLAGMSLPDETFDPQEQARSAYREKLLTANKVASSFYSQFLEGPEGDVGRKCLEERGIDMDFARSRGLGMAPDAWDGLIGALKSAGVSASVAEKAGLVIPRSSGSGWYDRFRNRLIFPISDRRGRVVAFGGRTLGDDDAKYINSPESPVYNKSETLYGFYEAQNAIHKEDRAIVVEGYFDVLALARAGIGAAVAPCGTALTERQITELRRKTRSVILLFDSDQAGKRAAMKSLGLCLKQGLWPSYLSVPDGKDPDDFVRENGAEAMQQLVEQHRPLADVFLEDSLAAAGEGALAADRGLETLAPMLANMAPIQRDDYSRRAADALGVDPRVVSERVRREAKRTRRSASRKASPTGGVEPTQAKVPQQPGPPMSLAESPDVGSAAETPDRRRLAPARPSERQLVRLMVQDLAVVAQAVEDFGILPWINHPEVGRVVNRLLEAQELGRTPTALELLDGLEDSVVRDDITAVLSDENSWYDSKTLEAAERECFIRLRYDWVEAQRARAARDLSAEERKATTDPEVMLALTKRCTQLNKELHSLQDSLRKSLHPPTE